MAHGSVSLSHVCFTHAGKIKLKMPYKNWIAAKSSLLSDVDFEENRRSDFTALAIILFNCQFNEKFDLKDKIPISSCLSILLKAKSSTNREMLSLIKDYPGRNKLAPLIARRVDGRFLEAVNLLVSGKDKNLSRLIELFLFAESHDEIFRNTVTIHDLLATMRVQDASSMKNPEVTERRISTKFSTEFLKKNLGDLVIKLKDLEAKLTSEEKRSLLRNWLLVNERSFFVKEVAEALGLSRKMVNSILKSVIAVSGVETKIKHIRSN